MKKGNKYEILIADDNSENLRVLVDILKNEGYKIRIAKNGKQVISSIKASEPDILLLDIHMPEMDGFEVCKELMKKDSLYKFIPIIFLSALGDSFNKVQAFKIGAVDYITKPFEIEEVKERIKIHLNLKFLKSENIKLKNELKEKKSEIDRLRKKIEKE